MAKPKAEKPKTNKNHKKNKQRRTPLTTKLNEDGHNRRGIQYGLGAMQGWRPEMEDRHHVKLSLKGVMKHWAYAAVFDGHGGRQVSTYCAKRLHKTLIAKLRPLVNEGRGQPGEQGDHEEENDQEIARDHHPFEERIAAGFRRVDNKIRYKTNDNSGSTAVCTFISPDHFYIANLGDSRAVLCRNGKVHFATKDHKPETPGEKARILKAGGYIRKRRVNGGLALSRAFGDFRYKANDALAQWEQLVISKPDVTVIERNNQADEFLLLACDGVWDVMTNSEAIKFVKTQMGKTNDMKVICNRLLDHCLAKGSKDNMSVVIVKLPGCATKKALQEQRQAHLQGVREAMRNKKRALGRRAPACGINLRRRISNHSRNRWTNRQIVNRPRPIERGRVDKKRIANSYIRYFVEYYKFRGGNMFKAAKRCARSWRVLPLADKRRYERRYKEAKRRQIRKARQ